MTQPLRDAMWSQLLQRTAGQGMTLQGQIRQMLVAAILNGWLQPNQAAPSSRHLAAQLGVSRITVVLAYQQLVDEGYLLSHERRGHFVGPAATNPPRPNRPRAEVASASAVQWSTRIAQRPSQQRSIVKPSDWQRSPYPFLYGQFDESLFPTAAWRESCLKALSVLDIRRWAPDQITRDDDSLVEQICTRILPRRGVWATADELIITVGAQHALYMVADLLIGPHTAVAMENPGYPDARNIFTRRSAHVLPVATDEQGLVVGSHLHGFDYLYTTPGHQCPSGATLPMARRQALLRLANDRGMVIIEDDFESESIAEQGCTPALKSLDQNNRVIYIGSLSKCIAPGLRIGYIVADPELIAELRALRRLMIRHPSAFVQRSLSLFISLGHHHAHLRRLGQAQRSRRALVLGALDQHAPSCRVSPFSGGGAHWVCLPPGVSATALAAEAARRGVLVEPGDVFFFNPAKAPGYLRLGHQSIQESAIAAGIAQLAQSLHAVQHAHRLAGRASTPLAVAATTSEPARRQSKTPPASRP